MRTIRTIGPSSPTPQAVIRALQRRQYAPVYFLQGQEPYYIDQITSYIEDHVLTGPEKQMNCIIMYGKEQRMHHVLSCARQLPLWSSQRIVLVKEAQNLQDLSLKTGQERLLDYLTSPNPSTILVFAYKHKILDASSRLAKALCKQGVLVTTKTLYVQKISDWVQSYGRDHKRTITPKAAAMLQELVGTDLQLLANELQKVFANLKIGSVLDDQDILTYVGQHKRLNVFELQQAVGNKDMHKVCRMVVPYAGQHTNQSLFNLLHVLFAFFSKLLCIHHAPQRSRSDLAQLLRVHPYFVGEYLQAARQYTLPQVTANLHHIHRADLQLKGIGTPVIAHHSVLQELVFRLVHG